MTRREEIVTQAAREQSKLYESPDWRAGFVSGAMWSDKTMLDKVCKWLKENVKVPLSRLAGLLEYTEAISHDFYKWREQKRKDGFGTNAEEEVAYIVGKIFEYNENRKKENDGNEW